MNNADDSRATLTDARMRSARWGVKPRGDDTMLAAERWLRTAGKNEAMRGKRALVWTCAVSGAALLTLTGCASAPPSAAPTRLMSPPAVALPIATRVAIQVDPAMAETQTVEFRGASWQYADASLMQEAAARVFAQVFQEVGTLPAPGAPAVTLQLHGSSSLNAAMNEYYANVTVRVFSGANTYAQPIASFAGTGQASEPNFVRDGIARAYEGAFRQIVDFLLADPHFVASLRGY